MIVLDENILESQRSQLRRWRIHFSQIGHEIARKGIHDDDIITLLRRLRRPTIVSWDRDFFDRTWCSDHFCLVYLDVRQLEVAQYVRRLLRHPAHRRTAQCVRKAEEDVTVQSRVFGRPTCHGAQIDHLLACQLR